MAWNGSCPKENIVKARRKPIHVPIWLWMAMGIIGVVADVGWLVSASKTDEEHVAQGKIKHNAARYAKSPQDAVRAAMPTKGTGKTKTTKRRPPRVSGDLFAHFQGEDRKLAEKIQAGLDADDFKATVQSATAALKSDNPELRLNAVEALGWFGASALPELTSCMTDSDTNVRQAAQNQWEQAIQDIDRPTDRFNIVAAAFATLPDEDALTSLGGLLNNAATEMIDGEDDAGQANEKRLQVLQTLVDIIEGGKPQNVEAAKEAYSSITCNDWVSVEEAERYLDDPDNYDPDERQSADLEPNGESAEADVSASKEGSAETDAELGEFDESAAVKDDEPAEKSDDRPVEEPEQESGPKDAAL